MILKLSLESRNIPISMITIKPKPQNPKSSKANPNADWQSQDGHPKGCPHEYIYIKLTTRTVNTQAKLLILYINLSFGSQEPI